MLLFTTLRSTLRRFQTRPLRTLLILLQILLGALAMTLALSVYLHSLGAEANSRFDLRAGSTGESTASFYQLFDQAGLPDLLELAPAVSALALYDDRYRPEVVVHGRRYQFRRGAAISPEYFAMQGIEASEGTLFSQQDARQNAHVALISEASARILFEDADPIGQELGLLPQFTPPGTEAAPTPYRVVGTFHPPERPGAFTDNPAIYFLLLSERRGRPTKTSTLKVLAEPGRREEAETQIVSAARQVYEGELEAQDVNESNDMYIVNAGDIFTRPDSLDPDLLIFGLFGIISLVVGGIGIFSVTVVETVERRHDIGLRRALGATGGRINLEFMVEAGMLALFGGLLGVLAAVMLVRLLQGRLGDLLFQDGGFVFDPLAALLVLAIVMVLGAVLGLLPTLRIGRMKPVEALRDV